jgi:uncharacterized protein YbcC (UPF0753/DUF2309 family)
MTAMISRCDYPGSRLDQARIDAAIESACASIAPTWPLDRFIAVSPYWGLIDRPFSQVDGELSRLAGSSLHMPREYYRAAFACNHFTRDHVALALAEIERTETPEELIAQLAQPGAAKDRLPLLSDCIDAGQDAGRQPAWQDTIAHQISQFCAAYFDDGQADWRPASSGALYTGWRRAMSHDHSVTPLMHAPHIVQRSHGLPIAARESIAMVLIQLNVAPRDIEDFLRAVLLRVSGWGAWCAYLRWQARLAGRDDDHIVELLAIRLAWEYLLDDGARDDNSIWARWQSRSRRGSNAAPSCVESICHRAMEIAYQQALATALATPAPKAAQVPATAQAIFCIDVRSEVFRRALEHVAPTVETRGFAGFFGLPISYTPLGTDAARPQLPGLLAPAFEVTETSGCAEDDTALQRARRQHLGARRAWLPFQRLPASAFTLVEATGIGALGQLVRRSLPGSVAPANIDSAGLTARQAQRIRPRLQFGATATPRTGADLALGVLRAMSLGDDFAPIVLLVGHGSQSANNPHAAGLDCGACCGQTGEVNARALAALLNDAAVRAELVNSGVRIPAHTHFVAALHNTTTDDVQLFDTDLIPASHLQNLERLADALRAAGERARRERAPQLGLGGLVQDGKALAAAVRARANDWAQTRPEWGLANNAAFVIGPRSNSRHVNFHGRAFLHDYDWRRDATGSVLELIMTAPMVVAHWINMQYLASTVDNHRYGSGNKVLHNVVGGHIGVFEGNGGDLRIGLPLQSVHDGERWMHTPLRLSVFIEAPRPKIDAVIAKHATVQHLLHNGWLHLFSVDSAANTIESYRAGEWHPLLAVTEASRA